MRMLRGLGQVIAGLGLVLAATVMPALAQKQGGTLRVYQREAPPSASIHEEATISTAFPFMGVFNNLVMFDPKVARESVETVVPDLAKSWVWNDAKTRVTFTLETGVKWHDGKPFTAKDVVCTWDLISGVTEGARKSPRKIWYDNVDKVVAEGDDKVAFELKSPQPSLFVLLASGMTPIYPCHVPVKDMRSAPIGTGPFKLAEFKRTEVIRIVRNPDYWKKGLPYLDAVEFRVIPNLATRVLAFTAGEFDLTFVGDLSVPLLADVQSKMPTAQCAFSASGVYANVMVNRTTAPFDNARIREAMTLSLDRAGFNQIIGQNKMLVGGTMMPLPDGLWGMPADLLAKLPGYGADVEKSRAEGRKIMEGLGYTADKPLKIKVTTRALDLYRDPAVLLIDNLKSIHIQGELNVVDSNVWYNMMQRKDYTVALNVTGVGVDDPDANLVENYLCKSERNFTNYCNPEVDKLIMAQSSEQDIAKRKAIVWDIERKLVEDAARPVIYHARGGTCWTPKLKGIVRHNNSIYNDWRFETFWLE